MSIMHYFVVLQVCHFKFWGKFLKVSRFHFQPMTDSADVFKESNILPCTGFKMNLLCYLQ